MLFIFTFVLLCNFILMASMLFSVLNIKQYPMIHFKRDLDIVHANSLTLVRELAHDKYACKTLTAVRELIINNIIRTLLTIGVAEYQLTKKLSRYLQGQLPSAKELIEIAKMTL